MVRIMGLELETAIVSEVFANASLGAFAIPLSHPYL